MQITHGLFPLVLAAGASSRMGVPKEFMEFQGVTCLELVLRACEGGGLDRPIVVTREERRAQVEALIDSRALSATVVVNLRPEFGQTSSLQAGLLAMPTEARGFLIYPVDHPLVRGPDLQELVTTFTSQKCSLAVPSFDHRRGHPVVVDAALREPLLALAPTGSARQVLAAHGADTRFVEFDDDRALIDMDTPAAYELCRRRLAARASLPPTTSSM